MMLHHQVGCRLSPILCSVLASLLVLLGVCLVLQKPSLHHISFITHGTAAKARPTQHPMMVTTRPQPHKAQSLSRPSQLLSLTSIAASHKDHLSSSSTSSDLKFSMVTIASAFVAFGCGMALARHALNRALGTTELQAGTAYDEGYAMAAISGDVGREDLKRMLMRQATAPAATPRSDLVATVEALETLNPTPEPANSPLVSGTWALLFAGAPTPEIEAQRAQKEGIVGSTISPRLDKTGSTGSGPLGRGLANLRSGFATTRGTWQDIDAAGGRVRNRADFDLFWGTVQLAFCIEGSCYRVPANETSGQAVRLAVTFERVKFTLGRGGPLGDIPSNALSIPLKWLNGGQGPQGWVDTTFVDEDMRLGRGDKGTIFVTARLKTAEW